MENHYIKVVVLYGDDFDVVTRKLYVEYPSDNPKEVIYTYLSSVYPSIGQLTSIYVDDIYVNNNDYRLYAVFGCNGDMNTTASNIINNAWNKSENNKINIHGPVVLFTVMKNMDIAVDFTSEMYNAIF